jgi:putative SOS response-associated peptidase YedK
MCGRFVQFRRLAALQKYFPIDAADVDVTPNYNVAPTQEVLTITRHDHKNYLEKLHWGLVPFWSKDTTIGSRMINARSETITSKPSFKTALQWRRCLILADGFYEWTGGKGNRQPMFLTLPDGRPFAFAGLWEAWNDRGKEPTPYRSCTILTVPASESVKHIHHRMPVILKPAAYAAWLDRKNQAAGPLLEIVQTQSITLIKSVPVSTQVNSAKVNRPGNIRPVDPQP